MRCRSWRAVRLCPARGFPSSEFQGGGFGPCRFITCRSCGRRSPRQSDDFGGAFPPCGQVSFELRNLFRVTNNTSCSVPKHKVFLALEICYSDRRNRSVNQTAAKCIKRTIRIVTPAKILSCLSKCFTGNSDTRGHEEKIAHIPFGHSFA